MALGATRLLSFDPRRVYAHPKVVAWYASLEARGLGAPPAAAPSAAGGSGLTAEQRARIEASKAAALARRQQSLAGAPRAV